VKRFCENKCHWDIGYFRTIIILHIKLLFLRTQVVKTTYKTENSSTLGEDGHTHACTHKTQYCKQALGVWFYKKTADHYFGVVHPGKRQDNFTQFPLPSTLYTHISLNPMQF
jgi:hypothetical protein